MEVCLSSLCLGSFVPDFLSGWFCSGRFLYVPLLSEYIRYNRKLNITFHFRFHMYEKNLKSVTSHALGPPPSVINCHTFSDPLPSSVTYFEDGPYPEAGHEEKG